MGSLVEKYKEAIAACAGDSDSYDCENAEDAFAGEWWTMWDLMCTENDFKDKKCEKSETARDADSYEKLVKASGKTSILGPMSLLFRKADLDWNEIKEKVIMPMLIRANEKEPVEPLVPNYRRIPSN